MVGWPDRHRDEEGRLAERARRDAASAAVAPGPDRGASDRVPRLAHQPGLDGLRGLAVAAVLAFHAEFSWARGGYLGVSTFFTLSGFLITSLLLLERRHTGTIGLRRFWERRFRRLMPAAIATLLGVCLYGAFVADAAQIDELRGDVLASLFYVANWRFILTGQSYLDLFAAPSPVQHFWSLAIEEQFYLLFPLLVFGVLALGRGSRRWLGITLGTLTVISTVLLAALYQPGDTTRAYYGTGTRAAELLVGSLLALVVVDRTPLRSPRVQQVAGWGGAAALGVIVGLYATVPQSSAWLYHGGLLLVAALGALVILAALQGSGPVAAVLSLKPLRALGLISYGVYLFHWPIFLWLDERRTGLDQWPLFILRVVVTLALAVASFHLLEQPIRTRRRLAGRRQELIALPLAMSLVIGATVLVTLDPPEDPLELVSAAEEPPPPPPPPEPVPGIDRPARVLVAGDQLSATLVPGLERWAAAEGSLQVQGVAAGCGDRIERDTCGGWVDAWTPALESFDPDVVLLSLGGTDLGDIRAAGGPGAPALEDAGGDQWFRERLSAAADVLAADGAVVTVIPFPHPLTGMGVLDVPAGVRDLQFLLDDVVTARDDLELAAPFDLLPVYPGPPPPDLPDPLLAGLSEWADMLTAALAPRLLDLAREEARADAGARVMLVGDSVAYFIGTGLEDWGHDTREATVWNTGVWGCGIARGGDIVTSYGEVPTLERCDDWEARWRQQLEVFEPDIVVVLTGLWDLADRRRPEWSEPVGPGDPRYDDYLLAEYLDAVDVAGSTGADVVWLKTPCFADSTFPGPLFETAAFDRERLGVLNEEIVPRLLEARPEVRLVDLYALACPDGTFTASLGGYDGARPDGVHFSPDAARWLADSLGPQVLASD